MNQRGILFVREYDRASGPIQVSSEFERVGVAVCLFVVFDSKTQISDF